MSRALALILMLTFAAPAGAVGLTFEGDTVTGQLVVGESPTYGTITQQFGTVVAGPGIDLTGEFTYPYPPGAPYLDAAWRIDIDIVGNGFTLTTSNTNQPYPLLSWDILDVTISDLDFLGDLGGGTIQRIDDGSGNPPYYYGRDVTFDAHSVTIRFTVLESGTSTYRLFNTPVPEPERGLLSEAAALVGLALVKLKPRRAGQITSS